MLKYLLFSVLFATSAWADQTLLVTPENFKPVVVSADLTLNPGTNKERVIRSPWLQNSYMVSFQGQNSRLILLDSVSVNIVCPANGAATQNYTMPVPQAAFLNNIKIESDFFQRLPYCSINEWAYRIEVVVAGHFTDNNELLLGTVVHSNQ